jgi:hypothetical protein
LEFLSNADPEESHADARPVIIAQLLVAVKMGIDRLKICRTLGMRWKSATLSKNGARRSQIAGMLTRRKIIHP